MTHIPSRVAAMLDALHTPAATVYAQAGEANLFLVGDHLVIDAIEERPVGENRVREHRATLRLTRSDASDLMRALDYLLHKSQPVARWSETALAEMAMEAVA